MLDLSMLDVTTASGKPLEIRLVDIDEDPEQPRKEFSKDAMTDMVASIVATGVRTPVSVRPHPADAGRYMLNYGARRYRASIAAGRKTIPAFVDEQHSDYDQVIENLQREALTPMELAMFIKRKQAEGSKPAEIAKRLGKQKTVITFHQSLIDAPALIERVYASGQCTSPRTLYELRKLFEKYPRKVEAWVASAPEISRASIAELAQRLKPAGKQSGSLPATEGASDAPRVGQGLEACHKAAGAVPSQAERHVHDAKPGEGGQSGDGAEEEIANPVVMVKHAGRAAAILLDWLPSRDGLVRLKFEDGIVAEVEAQECIITGLYDVTDAPIPV